MTRVLTFLFSMPKSTRSIIAAVLSGVLCSMLSGCPPKKTTDTPTQPTATATTTPTTTATGTPTGAPSSTAPTPPAPVEEVYQQLTTFCACDAAAGPVHPELSPQSPPKDVSISELHTCSARMDSCQRCFQCFGWQLFLTMNWPAAGSSQAEPQFGKPGDTAPVVWEAYKAAGEVFAQAPPGAWGTSDAKHMLATSAVIHLTEALQPDSNWLTDRSGKVVYYESRLNKDAFDYIVTNKLYSQQGLYAALTSGQGLSLPDGSQSPYQEGAIEIKAAWREVPEGQVSDFASRFKLSKAAIGPERRPATVALIGLHIAKKTPKAPQWVWVTFEHEDNAPDVGAVDPNRNYSLFNPELDGAYKPNQSSPPSKFARPPTPKDRPVQVTRLTPLGAQATALNALMRQLIQLQFADSVFQHYRLIDVQWAKDPQPVSPKSTSILPYGSPTPAVLANVALETYQQDKNSGGGALYVSPDSPDYGKSSCIGCHSTAAITPTFKGVTFAAGAPKRWFTDYSALFFRAQRHPE